MGILAELLKYPKRWSCGCFAPHPGALFLCGVKHSLTERNKPSKKTRRSGKGDPCR